MNTQSRRDRKAFMADLGITAFWNKVPKDDNIDVADPESRQNDTSCKSKDSESANTKSKGKL